MWEIYELSSPPPSSSRSGAQPTTPIPYLYTYWGGLWVNPEGVGGGEGSRARQSPVSKEILVHSPR